MKVLFCGDVVGKSGRDVISNYLSDIIKEHQIDFTIVNGENSAHGFGITGKIADTLFSAGADVITLGNHSFDNPDIITYMEDSSNKPVIRPINYEQSVAGLGYCMVEKNGITFLVINLMAELYTNTKIPVTNPFVAIDSFLKEKRATANIIIVDFHGETTSEKNAMGHFLDGRVTAVLGTHTHIQTNDARIMKKGTAFITDVGMCGDYNSIIGMQKENIINSFYDPSLRKRMEPANGSGTIFAVIIEADKIGKATKITPIKKGALL